MAAVPLENSLNDLGLNKYEARVYLALVSDGTATARNISETTGIPYGKVYEVVDSLARKGFVVTLPSKPMKVRPVPPKEALVAVKTSLRKKFRELESCMTKELEPIFMKTRQFFEPREAFWLINGRPNICRKCDELITASQHHIYIFTSANGMTRLRAHSEALREAQKRGVKILLTGGPSDGALCDFKSLRFCEFRHSNGEGNYFLSVDGRECIIAEPIPDNENLLYGRDIGMWVVNPSFVKFMENLFLSHFGAAKETKETDAKPDARGPRQDNAVKIAGLRAR